jgi:hypothetical protein
LTISTIQKNGIINKLRLHNYKLWQKKSKKEMKRKGPFREYGTTIANGKGDCIIETTKVSKIATTFSNECASDDHGF